MLGRAVEGVHHKCAVVAMSTMLVLEAKTHFIYLYQTSLPIKEFVWEDCVIHHHF